MLFGQKATKWLKLMSVNRTSGMRKSSPNLARSRVRPPTAVLEQKAGVVQGKLMTDVLKQEGQDSRIYLCEVVEGWDEQ